MTVIDSRVNRCGLCGDQNIDCPVCSGTRAATLSREARKLEAVNWIRSNLMHNVRGENLICAPTTPEDFTLMVMAIMEYARRPSEMGDGPPPVENKRFGLLEFPGAL